MSDSEHVPMRKMDIEEAPESVRAELSRVFGPGRWKAYRVFTTDTNREAGLSFNRYDAVVAWSDGKWSVAVASLSEGKPLAWHDSLESACVRAVVALSGVAE